MKEKIYELRKNGYTLNQIVDELNCSKSTVSYHINKIGLGGVKYEPKLIDNDIIEKIKNYRLSLKTYDEILKLIDISKDTLVKICRELGLNKPVNHIGVIKEFDLDELLKFYNETKSIRKTAKHFKIDKQTLRTHYITDEHIIKKVKTQKKRTSNPQAVIEWRKRKKQELVEYKGGKCERCGYNKSTRALQFHHIDPNEKDFTISRKSYSIERLKKEVDKCIMVCANCHLEIHEEIDNNSRHITSLS
jgi:DNA invertase Pin-like site-specific DNA recombinase